MIDVCSTANDLFTVSRIAERAGFRSRSFPRDVMLGKKRITLISLPKFIRGLDLDQDLANLFVTLVEIEHADCRTKNRSPVELNRKLQLAQKRLMRRFSDGIIE
jgi:uncharacterized protein (TIGR02147 family)